ncbi:MAG: hypothetical protein LIP03_15610 [Bacteroidales bacterium]|nr:hypothetical protein [Bacteroidales bacterium]
METLSQKYVDAVLGIAALGKVGAIITLLIGSLAVGATIYLMGRYYNKAERPIPILALALGVASIVLIVMPFFAPEVTKEYEAAWLDKAVLGISMLWWTCTAIYSAWCIQRSGLDEDYQRNDRNFLYHIGRIINNALYAVMALAIALVWIFAFCTQVSMPRIGEESITTAALTAVISVGFLAVTFIAYLKLFGKVFYTANPLMFKILTGEFFLGVFVLAWRFNYANVSGWMWWVTTAVIVYLALVATLSSFKQVRLRRCPICHCMEASLSKAFRESSTSKTTDWFKGLGGPGIHAKGQVVAGSYQTEHHVTRHTTEHVDTYTCPRCGYDWLDIYTTGSEEKGKATGSSRWLEWKTDDSENKLDFDR